jgi:hypothetical protein
MQSNKPSNVVIRMSISLSVRTVLDSNFPAYAVQHVQVKVYILKAVMPRSSPQ